MDEDPYASLVKYCKPTASQEEKLRTFPFARESEVFPELSDSLSSSPSPTPPEPAEIIMLSLPDSGSVGRSLSLENGEFQTPPEQANSSSQPYLSGSEDPRPPQAAAALGSQSDSSGDKQDLPADEDGAKHQGIVDLRTECDDLGFSEPQVIKGVSAPKGSDNATELHGGDFETEVLKANNDEPASKRIRVSKEDLGVQSQTLYVGETEPIPIEIKNDESVNTDIIGLEFEEAREKEKIMVSLDSSEKAAVHGGAICEIGSSSKWMIKLEDTEEELPVVYPIGKAANEKAKGANGKEIYDIAERCDLPLSIRVGEKLIGGEEEIRRLDLKNDIAERRDLPLPIRVGEKIIGGEEGIRRLDLKNGSSFKDIVEALGLFLRKANDGGKDDDDSLMETAKKRGWVFPKPRWWPPEGF